ncbi:Calcium-transporting ATPase 1 [Listeria monocytogenes N53-1]|nr:Calcium-transporting ATPase 1 [Listeria monocytogenes N53-1]
MGCRRNWDGNRDGENCWTFKQHLKTDDAQLRLKELAKRLSIVALLAGILIFIIDVYVYGETIIETLMIAISLAVAAVPETHLLTGFKIWCGKIRLSAEFLQ